LSTTAQVHILETPTNTTIVLPHVALEQLTPPTPPSGNLSEEILSSSVVTTNSAPAQQALEGSPAPVPEPSTVTLTLLVFGASACWHRWWARV
jgi:hypothetical protein